MIRPPQSPSRYLTGSVWNVMITTAISLLPGTIALSGYNIADAYFVAKLGTAALAAMGYTFPPILVIMALFRGLSVGILTTVSQAEGANRKRTAAQLVSLGLIFAALLSVAIGIVGYYSMDWVLCRLGAQGDALELSRQYMIVTYWTILCAGLVITTNDVLISIGAPQWASGLMCGSLFLNIALDPALIFGFGPIPALGISGAAWATAISQFAAIAVSFLLLWKKRYLTWSWLPPRRVRILGGRIIRFAIPSVLSMLLLPLGNAVVTQATSTFGDAAVAASAAGGRIESLAFILPMALGIALLPMIGQNFGAKNYERINQIRRVAMRFALTYLIATSVLFFLAADFLAGFFAENNPDVRRILVLYLQIVSWGFCMIEIHRYGTFFLLGCNHPKSSAFLNAFRILLCLVPLTLLAQRFGWLPGLFIARLLADLISGILGWTWGKRITDQLSSESCLNDPDAGIASCRR